ncbi:MAG: cytochrome c oxidase accessory protein CcoG, partial [Pseudomonadota bacterium]
YRIRLAGTERLTVEVAANETRLQRVFLEAKPGSAAAEAHLTPATIWIEHVGTGRSYSVETVFNGRDPNAN